MKLEREAVDALAREVLALIGRLRPVLEAGPAFWPSGRGRAAAALSRDLATAVEALDAALEELYFQTDSLESAHLALEIERRSYQELFDGGPDGYLVTDPVGLIIRANARAGEVFACPAADLVGEPLTGLIRLEDRPALHATLEGLERRDPNGEWIGVAIRASASPFWVALTSIAVRHGDGSVYRVRWSVRDISGRKEA